MTTNQYKIAIIGPNETVSGFRALGVDALDARTGSEAMEQLRQIKINRDNGDGPHYAVVCIIEDLLTDVDSSEYSKIISGPLPAVISLPGPQGSQGVALARLRRLAEQAVGSAII